MDTFVISVVLLGLISTITECYPGGDFVFPDEFEAIRNKDLVDEDISSSIEITTGTETSLRTLFGIKCRDGFVIKDSRCVRKSKKFRRMQRRDISKKTEE